MSQHSEKRSVCSQAQGHHLTQVSFERVLCEDREFLDIVSFFGLGVEWVQEMTGRGLLFWQSVRGSRVRLVLVSEGVARVFDAEPADRKALPWVRLGVALFEQLPKDLCAESAPIRWRVAQEGRDFVAPLLGKRLVRVEADALLRLLHSENLQAKLEDLPGVMDGEGILSAAGEDRLLSRRVICGGVLVGSPGTPFAGLWASGALTPHKLLLLINAEEAAALAEALAGGAPAAAPAPRRRQRPACWAGLVASVCGGAGWPLRGACRRRGGARS